MNKEHNLMDLAVEPIHSITNKISDNPNLTSEKDSVGTWLLF